MAKIEKIQRDYADMLNNKNNPDYKKPSLLYDLPKEPCGAVVVKEDSRTATEKRAQAMLIEQQKKLGTYETPVYKLITFQIVGVVNAQPHSKYTDSIQSYLQNLLSVENTVYAATIPRQAYDQLPAHLKIDELIQVDADDPLSILKTAGLASHILSFKTIQDARAFMAQETCPPSDTECQKLFTASPYGSNYLLLDQIGIVFQRVMVYALPVVLGLAVAYGMDRLYGPQLTDVANSAFGTLTQPLPFSLFDVSSPLLWLVLATIFATGMVASIQPLLRNVFRPPINDIRSE